MDEERLAAALRGATDDVQVPRDLVRHAERAGRARRARRRSAVTTLAVGVVVLAGGALVVPQIGSGGASSTAGGADASSSGAGGSASSAPSAPSPAAPPFQPAPPPGQDSGPPAEPPAVAGESAACDPPLVVGGVPAREGYATSVQAGGPLEITGSPLCGPVPPGTRYSLLLARGSQEPTVLADVVPADDGSFSTTVTVPSSTPPGPTRLSAVGSAWVLRPCPGTVDCTRPDYGAELDVLPAEATLQRSVPSPEESP